MKPRWGLLSLETVLGRPSGKFEEEGYASGFTCVAGFDEVGRGPLAGPVVAAAVVLPQGKTHSGIQDSKLIQPKKREELAAWIKEHAAAWGLGVVGAEEIDRINILKASLLAMAHAFKQLDPMPDYLLIDGPHEIPLEFLGRALPFQRAITKGDQLSLSIAAASILAKVARDRMMMDYGDLYPQYGFARHKGYGSPLHLAALRSYGPCPIHRRSFGPVREWAISSQQAAGQPGLLKADR